MAITFYTQSKKNPAPIYIRIREGVEIDAKARTEYSVDPLSLKKGIVKVERIPPRADDVIKKEIKDRNKELLDLQKSLDDLKLRVNNRLNSRENYEVVDSEWLKNIISPKEDNELPNLLSAYFLYYAEFKKNSLAGSSLKQIKVFGNRVKKYEEERGRVYLQQVNRKFSMSFQKWMDDSSYDHNTKVNTLKRSRQYVNMQSRLGLLYIQNMSI
ncbi:hypothetical protein KUL156_34940 [Alteromonas sp. KUL156]|nr:hypothetical protein KUL154_08920 [Alteromonas sp. KUL154]GFE00902.1 hypothetical protein KUL156_34940 [Alteromonas sp. KUL156]